MTAPPGDPEATSLARMLAAARAAGGPGHRFRVLQLPMNLLEGGAVLQPNTGPGDQDTVLDLARREGVAVLANRPLNAIVGGGLLRLALPAVPLSAPAPGPALAVLAAVEAEWARELAPALEGPRGHRADGPSRREAAGLFDWAGALDAFLPSLQGFAHWRDVERETIRPRVARTLEAVGRAAAGSAHRRSWEAWRDRFLTALDGALGAIGALAAGESRRALTPVEAALARHAPRAWDGEPLSRRALAAVAGTPGVTTVLVGMRELAWVDDALSVLGWPPPSEPRRLFEATAALRPTGRR